MLESTDYINQNGNNVPENNIVLFPHNYSNIVKDSYDDIIEDLRSNPKREWFTEHFYYCLPLLIGNQYGFGIKSLYDIDLTWSGHEDRSSLDFKINSETDNRQLFTSHFGSGILTIQNEFSLRTSPGINIMTMQPPNYFIPGLSAMTGVVETDNLRRDFTFNIKVTIPNMNIKIKKGDILASFIPIPRYFIDKFSFVEHREIFSEETLKKEYEDQHELSKQRNNEDTQKPHSSGRRYFNGIHAFGEKYEDHQKRISI